MSPSRAGIGFIVGPLEEEMIAEYKREEAMHEAELAYIQYSIGNPVFPPSPSTPPSPISESAFLPWDCKRMTW